MFKLPVSSFPVSKNNVPALASFQRALSMAPAGASSGSGIPAASRQPLESRPRPGSLEKRQSRNFPSIPGLIQFRSQGATLSRPFSATTVSSSARLPAEQHCFSLDSSEEEHRIATRFWADSNSRMDAIHNDGFYTLNTLPIEKCLIPVAGQIHRMRVLDVGSGTGMITRAVLKHASPVEMCLYEPNKKIVVAPPAGFSAFHYHRSSFLFQQLKPVQAETAVIAHPPLTELSSLQHFIQKQKIKNAILIIPANKLKKFSSDYEVIGSMRAEDFYPIPAAGSDVHLIIKKGFTEDAKELAGNFIDVGRHRLPVSEILEEAVHSHTLSSGIIQQAKDLLGGNKFDSIEHVVKTLQRKQDNQTGAEFKRNIDLAPHELEIFHERHQNTLAPLELKNLETAITETGSAP